MLYKEDTLSPFLKRDIDYQNTIDKFRSVEVKLCTDYTAGLEVCLETIEDSTSFRTQHGGEYLAKCYSCHCHQREDQLPSCSSSSKASTRKNRDKKILIIIANSTVLSSTLRIAILVFRNNFEISQPVEQRSKSTCVCKLIPTD